MWEDNLVKDTGEMGLQAIPDPTQQGGTDYNILKTGEYFLSTSPSETDKLFFHRAPLGSLEYTVYIVKEL